VNVTIDPRIRERRLEVQREAGRRRLRFTLPVVFAAVAAAVVYLTIQSPLLDVDHVRVRGAEHVAPEEVVAATGVDRGEALLRVDDAAVRGRVEQLPWVERAEVRKGYPGTLRITVHERVPVAYVQRDEAHYAVVGTDGHVITDVPSPLPGLIEVRNASEVPPAGKALQPAGAARVVPALPAALASRVAALDLRDASVTLVLHGAGEVRLCTADDVAAKGAAALAVLERLGDTSFAYVDVCTPASPFAGGLAGV
jgi:cell division protein FtsQ